jgi:hypothetical protein
MKATIRELLNSHQEFGDDFEVTGITVVDLKRWEHEHTMLEARLRVMYRFLESVTGQARDASEHAKIVMRAAGLST